MSIKFISHFLNLVLQEILVMAPELQEDGMVQKLIEFISITCLSTGATRDPGHGTKNCKRCPSTSLYELLSLNS